MKIYKLFIAAALMLTIFSCKKYADPSSEDLGYSYFPINDGDYSIYSVSDTTFTGGGLFDTSYYLVKEEIHKPITVNDEVRYQIYVYYKNKGDAWKSYPDSVWTVFNSQNRIVRVENNVRFVKLVFPLQVGKSWDANISDPANDPQDYSEMKNIFRPFSYGSHSYPQTVSVIEYDNISFIDEHYSIEVYANNVGLVYKEKKDYSFQPSSGPVTPDTRQGGTHYIKKLLVHGRYK